MPQGAIQQVARQSALYALGNVAVKFGGLVLAPILLNPQYLDVASYGYLALILLTAQLGIVVVGLGVSSGLLRFWTHPDYRERTSVLASSALVVCLVLGTVVPGLIHLFFSDDLARLLLDDGSRTNVIGMILLYSGFKVVGSVPATVFRVQERPLMFGLTQMLEVSLLIGLTVYWLAVQGIGLEGVVRAYAVAAGVTTVTATVVAFAPLVGRPSFALVRPLIAFGAPLALASLSAWILNSSDRYLLKWLTDPTVVAAYDWAYRVAGIVNVLLVQSFQLAFVVIGLRHLDNRDVGLHREMFRHYVVWAGLAILGLSVFTEDAMGLMSILFGVDSSYVGISVLVLLVGIGVWSYGTNQIVASALASAGKTGAIAVTVASAAAVNVALNLALIPLFGGAGAAGATALAFLCLTAISTAFSERQIRVGYSWSLAALVLVLVTVLFLASTISGGWPGPLRVPFRLALVALYALLLLLSRSYRVDEFRGGIRTMLSILGVRSSGS